MVRLDSLVTTRGWARRARGSAPVCGVVTAGVSQVKRPALPEPASTAVWAVRKRLGRSAGRGGASATMTLRQRPCSARSSPTSLNAGLWRDLAGARSMQRKGQNFVVPAIQGWALRRPRVGHVIDRKVGLVRVQCSAQFQDAAWPQQGHRQWGVSDPPKRGGATSHVQEGGRSRPDSHLLWCCRPPWGGKKRRPVRAASMPSGARNSVSSALCWHWRSRSCAQLRQPIPLDPRHDHGDNSPPVSCPPVCPPSSTTHDVPTREERWR